MDEFLKFLPLIAYVVYRIVAGGKKTQEKRKVKPRTQSKPKPKPKTSTPSLEDILRELSGESRQQAKPIVQKPKPKKRVRQKIDIVDHSKDERIEYVHDANTGKSVSAIREEILEEQGLDKSEEHIEIDLKQAIIYDAILNRPHN